MEEAILFCYPVKYSEKAELPKFYYRPPWKQPWVILTNKRLLIILSWRKPLAKYTASDIDDASLRPENTSIPLNQIKDVTKGWNILTSYLTISYEDFEGQKFCTLWDDSVGWCTEFDKLFNAIETAKANIKANIDS